ncbi:MAG: hypothetical protein ACOC91_00120 [bacterium]
MEAELRFRQRGQAPGIKYFMWWALRGTNMPLTSEFGPYDSLEEMIEDAHSGPPASKDCGPPVFTREC